MMTDSVDNHAMTAQSGPSLFYGSPIITIKVGQGDRRRTFKVATDVLTKNSPVLAAMLEGRRYIFISLQTVESCRGPRSSVFFWR